MFDKRRILTGYHRVLVILIGICLTGNVYSQNFPGDWEAFPSHMEYVDFMQGLVKDYPEICFLDTIGMSVGGRPILVMKISDSVNVREPEPAFYYSSTMHGNETSGYQLMLRLMDHLCRNYGQDELCTRLVDNVEIWINPLSNPDGTYRYNDTLIQNPTRANLNGRDLNRNFPSQSGGVMNHEPEVLAQMGFMDSIHLVLSINIHDGSEVFNYPWDYWSRLHADNNWFIRAGRKYVDTVYDRRGIVTGYFSGFNDGITNGYAWYDISGGRQDYVTYFLHGREVTLEINDRKFPNIGDHAFLWHVNHPSLLQYIENILSGIQGTVADSQTGEPVRAKISIPGHDLDESHVFSDSLTGYFARLIEPGNWNLEFSAEGYISKSLPVRVLEWDIAARADVLLDPLSTGVRVEEQPEAWPNPWIHDTEIHFNVNIPGVRHFILAGMDGRIIMRDRLSCPVRGPVRYQLNGSNLNPGWYVFQIRSPEGRASVMLLKSE